MLEAGRYYHLYNRGNNREDLFKEERNYLYFLKLYEYHTGPVAETFSYCLLRNHFHLLVRIKDPSEHLPGLEDLEGVIKPSRAFSNLFNAYTKAINKAYQRTGSLFQKNFRSIEITSDVYFSRLVHYIHHNPQHHGFTDDYRTYPHSSYQMILSDHYTPFQREKVIQWFGGRTNFIDVHKKSSGKNDIIHLIGEDDD